MKRSKTNSGFLSILEKIVRSHPLIYFITRYFIRYTNIFEQDANGVSYIKMSEKVNIIDVGASDGIASKFFSRKLNVNKIICYEPYIPYVKILKKLNIKNIKVKPYGIDKFNKYYDIYFPRYKFFSKNLDLITYTFYNKKKLIEQIDLDFLFKTNIEIIKQKIYLKKIGKIKTKIDLIKIDVNGHELSVVKGLNQIIKKDRPALIIETGDDITSIEKYLKKYGFNKYFFSNKKHKFFKIKNYYPLNTYFLQKKHLSI
tara:strand:+ start:1023 stop:1793 length:771 start_codon:yes stop_codon:yes gene_type:complete